MFGSFGGVELIVIVLIILLLFGAKKIPELARGIGQGINEFKKASSDIRKEIEKGQTEADEIKKTNDTVKNKN
jgi:sec-independent protein translocase protein TatA